MTRDKYDSFNRSHCLAYSLVALQEMNLAFKYPIVFWNCACLITDSGGSNNEDMEEILLEHFKNRINPFNKNITNIRELYCLVKAYNYYKCEEKAEN